MNPSHCLHWYRTRTLLRSNLFRSLIYYEQISSMSNKWSTCDNTNILHGKINIGMPQKIQYRKAQFGRRYPIKVIDSVNVKTIDEYVEDAKERAVEAVLSSDETDFKTEHINSIKDQRKQKHLQKSQTDESKMKSSSKRQSRQSGPKSSHNDSDSEDEDTSRVFKDLNIQQYSKAKRIIRSYLQQGRSAHFREKEDFFCVEGWRLLAEGLRAGLKPLAIYFSRSRLFYNLVPSVVKTKNELTNILNLFPLYKTPYSVFKIWSSLTTPPGIIAVFPLSKAVELASQLHVTNPLPLTVILDEIRDPHNLGSIIRTLIAVGISKIILTKGCCDLWDTKVLRSTCGAQFRMPCLTKISWSEVETHLSPLASVYLANACQKREERDEVEDETGDDVLKEENDKLSPIDIANIREISFEESEKQTAYVASEEGERVRVNNSYEDKEHMDLFSNIDIPQYYYDTVNFFDGEIGQDQATVLIIGGEIGLSKGAKKFALENGGIQIGIPMLNDVESLNSSVAIGILVYETRRQYQNLLKQNKRETNP